MCLSTQRHKLLMLKLVVTERIQYLYSDKLFDSLCRYVHFVVGLSQKRRAPHKCYDELILQKATSSSIKHLMPQRYFEYDYNLHKNYKLIRNYYLYLTDLEIMGINVPLLSRLRFAQKCFLSIYRS